MYTKVKVHCLYWSVLRGGGDNSDKVYDWNSTFSTTPFHLVTCENNSFFYGFHYAGTACQKHP